jgi:hypothetical protein
MGSRRQLAIGAIAALAFAGVVLAATRPNRYAFLDRFHPIDLMRTGLPVTLPSSEPTVIVKLLQFRDSDSEAVRAALLREFPPVSEPTVDTYENSQYVKWEGEDGNHLLWCHEDWPPDSGWQLEVHRDETWFDRQIAGVRSLLHF